MRKNNLIPVREAAAKLKLSRSQVYRVARRWHYLCRDGLVERAILKYKPNYMGHYEGPCVSLYTFFKENEEDFLAAGIDVQLWRRLIARAPRSLASREGKSPANGKKVTVYLRDELMDYKHKFTDMTKPELYKFGTFRAHIGWGGKYHDAYQMLAEGSMY